jgi:hypothetical protein
MLGISQSWIVTVDYALLQLTAVTTAVQSQSYLTTDGQSVSLSWYQVTIQDPRPIFVSLSWKIFSDICIFLLMKSPSSVIYAYDCYWSLPALPLLDPSLAWLVTIPYWLSWETGGPNSYTVDADCIENTIPSGTSMAALPSNVTRLLANIVTM